MFVPQHAGVVNRITPNMFTAGKNIRSPEEWLAAILYSGQVTRIGQHLALVLFHIASEKGVASLSMRELQEITGWGKTTICDHLREIEGFIKTTFGKGRGKSTFELQGIITTAVEELRSVRQPDTKGDEPIASVRETDTNPDTNRSVREADSKPDTMADTNPSVRLPDTKTDTTQFSVRQADTTSASSRARIVPPKGGLSSEEVIKNSPPTPQASSSEEHAGHGVWVNCETVRHKDFSISIPGVAMRCAASGLSTDEIKSKIIGSALQWALEIESGKPPSEVVPKVIISALARTVMNDHFQAEVHHTRKQKAGGAPSLSREDARRKIDAIVGRRG